VFAISIRQRNLMIMWFANFMVAASATMILPFLSLYIKTFGSYSDHFVQRWSGYVFGITFLMAFFFSPFWGRFGDHYGYKKILLITGTGISFSIYFMGLVTTVEQLFILRLLMGIVTGFIPTSLALISSQTPKNIAGKTLGTLQTGTVSGGLLGPLIGGSLADTAGFQYTFIITSFVIALATLLVGIGVKEIRMESEKQKQKQFTRLEVLKHIFHQPILFTIMLLSFIIQTANSSIQPLLALYVNRLTHSSNIALLAGLTFSATGFGNMLSTRQWGKIGDKIGHERVLIILLVLSSVMFIPQAMAGELWQLVLFRFLFGIALGGLIPCITAYIRQITPLSMQGEVLGYQVSCRFLGNVIGPITGGVLSSLYSISTVFFMSSFLFLFGAALLWYHLLHEKDSVKSKHVEL
jgi:MFS transporter, DHA1 family, multidrug resistance protein